MMHCDKNPVFIAKSVIAYDLSQCYRIFKLPIAYLII